MDDKTFQQLAIPADGFDSLAQSFDDPPDWTIAAGPAEAFADRAFTASRSVNTQVVVKALVISPRYRWVWDGPTVAPARRLFGRSDGQTHGAGRVLGGGNTVQSGSRVLGGIL